MDDLDLTSILDDGRGPDATPEVLGRIVARQRRRRARHYRVVATTAMVVALAGVGAGVGLDQHGGTATAAGPTSPASSLPAGLKWVVEHGSENLAQSAGLPGQFGFSASLRVPNAPSSGLSLGAAIAYPASAAAHTGVVNGAPKSCAAKGCDVVYNPGVPRQLFTRHVNGVTIAASLVTFDYPSTIASGHVGLPTPPPTSPPAASSPPGTPTPVSAQPLPNITPKSLIHVTTTCLVASELVVDVSYGSVTRTLFVPAGGMSGHAISVVASAGTTLGSAGSVVVAVARTNPSVSSVSAMFPGGSSDRMAPRDGWAVLAQHLPTGANLSRGGAVDIEARAASGNVLETVHLPATGSLAAAPVLGVCHLLLVPLNVVSPPSGPPSGTSGVSSGSSGSSSVAGAKPSS